MTERISHKVGDTFDAAATYNSDLGVPVNLTAAGVTVRSAFRSGNKVYEATVTILDQALYPGQFQISRQTVDWPEDDELDWDIQYTQGSHVHSTETVRIVTKPDVTPNS